MIDTDKYEGHTEDEETWSKYANWATARYLRDADEQLIADAPLLLEEVKRLRSIIEMVSYDLEWYPERLDQNKRQLEYNIRKWKGEEE